MSHRPPHLNSHRRRARKQRLAARDGQQCYYCRRPFRELREATADHIVPVSLWRTWSVSALVLACRSCNDTKANRLPLSLALLLCTTFPPTGVNDASTPVHTADDSTSLTSVTPRVAPTVTPDVTPPIDADSTPVDAGSTPVNRPVDAPTVHIDGPTLTTAHDVFTAPFTLDLWRLLARLAHANQPTFTAVWSPDPTARWSTPDRRESTCHGRREQRPSARPNCLRAPRPVRTCAGPTGEAVPA
ncbi:HNH endonuclease [Streptomyces ipomoeae]|uniref:HNH endonuclease n=1 Tax=Streptomyces ipomoeae TaxID=103232 RepID=UPI0029AAD763|nr:HNH endonuclease [Streptomyces ipomoeae]MDX2820030.1 HNH endonuclease [Streptomyces ipomoeae]MDX2874410.1 HNH endonuclease [Streptomyces ipomoeae]